MLMHENMRAVLIGAACCGVVACNGVAQSVSDYAVQASATVQTTPPGITLSWPADPQATGYTLYRKGLADTSWGAGTVLAASATNYIDSDVVVGGAYEYQLSKTASDYYGEGYVYAGIQAPLVELRGKVVLLVDNTFSSSLAAELAQLQQDLVGDGWIVLRSDVARMAVDPANNSSTVWAARANELANVKAIIQDAYNADPANVKAVFLLGHLPVPYSGALAPDEHAEHIGAWPADGYYGDMTGTWTDSSVSVTTASDTRNWNVAGDGKFDQNTFPENLTLQVGRVDMANLPGLSQSELELLQQYLNKDHNFRNGLIRAQGQGLIDDNFGLSTGEPLAVNGWRNFAPFFGAGNIAANSAWFGTLDGSSYLCGYGCGSGTYTSVEGVGSTSDFAGQDPQVVFTMFFGSYFGDWDSTDNFMRAALGTATYTLASAWAGRPNWVFHHMALGETVGFGTLLTQNSDGTVYDGGNYTRYVHIALMGDPTLRLHVVGPPSALVVTDNSLGGVELGWTASTDTVLGYNVYRAAMAGGPFARVNGSLITGATYTDPGVNSNVWYMVRAVKLEVSGSGSYTNASQGIFQFHPRACNPGDTSLDWAVVSGNMQMCFTNLYGLSAVEGITLNNCTMMGTAYGAGFESGESVGSITLNTMTDLPKGTTNLVIVASKIDTGASAVINARVYDGCDNATQFDPVIANLLAQPAAPLWQTYSGVPSTEHYVTVSNGTPGLPSVKLLVNGWTYDLDTLAAGQVVVVDVGASMNAGAGNTILVFASGAQGASAGIQVSDTAGSPVLSVQPQVEAPLLSFVQDGAGVVLSWPAPAGFFTLQGRAGLDPATGWQDLVVNQQESQGLSFVTIQTGAACQLFRLRK